MTRSGLDHGAASLVVVALIAVTLSLAVAAAGVGTVLRARVVATAAADAASLAAAPATFPMLGLDEPGRIAATVAAENGARLDWCDCRIDTSWSIRTATVRVSVEVLLPVVGTAEVGAISRAEFRPVALTGY